MKPVETNDAFLPLRQSNSKVGNPAELWNLHNEHGSGEPTHAKFFAVVHDVASRRLVLKARPIDVKARLSYCGHSL